MTIEEIQKRFAELDAQFKAHENAIRERKTEIRNRETELREREEMVKQIKREGVNTASHVLPSSIGNKQVEDALALIPAYNGRNMPLS